MVDMVLVLCFLMAKVALKNPSFIAHQEAENYYKVLLMWGISNQDGNPDIIALVVREVRVYLGDGDGQFKMETIYYDSRFSFAMKKILISDVNNDEKLDIVAGARGHKLLLINNGQ